MKKHLYTHFCPCQVFSKGWILHKIGWNVTKYLFIKTRAFDSMCRRVFSFRSGQSILWTILSFLILLTVTWQGRYYSSHKVHLYWLVLQTPCDSCWLPTLSTAHLDATRALMILSLLACFIGIIIGIMAFIHYSSFDRFDKTFAAGILFFISCKLH